LFSAGTATVLKSLNRPIAGKTGTTNEERDAWFVGYTPDLVVGVFIGFDTPRPMGKGRTGGGVAAPIFGDFMKRALAEEPAAPFRVPPGLKLVRVNLKTGLRAGPNDSQVILEAFKPNEEPDDAYSIIGFQVSDTGTPAGPAPSSSTSDGAYSSASDAWAPVSAPPGNAPGAPASPSSRLVARARTRFYPRPNRPSPLAAFTGPQANTICVTIVFASASEIVSGRTSSCALKRKKPSIASKKRSRF